MVKKHRNSQKRIYFEDAEYFITSNTFNWYPYFKEPIFCDLFVENLRLCKRLRGFVLYAWFLECDHFHLLLRPSDECNISNVMHFLKRNISRDINFVIGYNKYDNTHFEGADHDPRLQWLNKSKWIFKFRFKIKYLNKNPFPKFRWQKSYQDHYIRNDDDFGYHVGYIAYNPIKHGLPDNWPYVFTNDKYADLIDDCL
jgi:REP element-mobilizing transposase RayT